MWQAKSGIIKNRSVESVINLYTETQEKHLSEQPQSDIRCRDISLHSLRRATNRASVWWTPSVFLHQDAPWCSLSGHLSQFSCSFSQRWKTLTSFPSRVLIGILKRRKLWIEQTDELQALKGKKIDVNYELEPKYEAWSVGEAIPNRENCCKTERTKIEEEEEERKNRNGIQNRRGENFVRGNIWSKFLLFDVMNILRNCPHSSADSLTSVRHHLVALKIDCRSTKLGFKDVISDRLEDLAATNWIFIC